MQLHFLDFDFSEDADGNGTLDAMAAAEPARLALLQSEIAGVLDWACARFGPPQPLEEGGQWDCELQGVREVATTLEVRHARGRLDLQPGTTGEPRVTLSVTLSGTAAFCQALQAALAAG